MSSMTNDKFAARIGVTESYGSYIRNGNRKPSGDVLIRIIQAFELDVNDAMNAYLEGATEFSAYIRKTVFDVDEHESESNEAEHPVI